MCDSDLEYLATNYNKDFDICKYWCEISKKKDCTGFLKYPNLSKIVKACLTITPANAQPERGFSINNNVTKERSSLSDMCINSLRMCKDKIRQNISISDIKITKQLITSVRKSHAEYNAYMAQKKAEENLKNKNVKLKQQ